MKYGNNVGIIQYIQVIAMINCENIVAFHVNLILTGEPLGIETYLRAHVELLRAEMLNRALKHPGAVLHGSRP